MSRVGWFVLGRGRRRDAGADPELEDACLRWMLGVSGERTAPGRPRGWSCPWAGRDLALRSVRLSQRGWRGRGSATFPNADSRSRTALARQSRVLCPVAGPRHRSPRRLPARRVDEAASVGSRSAAHLSRPSVPSASARPIRGRAGRFMLPPASSPSAYWLQMRPRPCDRWRPRQARAAPRSAAGGVRPSTGRPGCRRVLNRCLKFFPWTENSDVVTVRRAGREMWVN